jgi:hypothetical protein
MNQKPGAGLGYYPLVASCVIEVTMGIYHCNDLQAVTGHSFQDPVRIVTRINYHTFSAAFASEHITVDH